MRKELEYVVAILKRCRDPQARIATFIEQFGGPQIYRFDNHQGAERRWHGQNGFLHYFAGILHKDALEEPPYPIAKGFDSERNGIFVIFQKSIWPVGTVFNHTGEIYVVVYNETTSEKLNSHSRQQTLFCALRKDAFKKIKF